MIKSTIMALALMIATGAMASNANAAMISPFQFTPVVAEMAAPNANLHVVKFGDRFKKWGRKIKKTTRKTTRNFKQSFKKTTRATIRTNKDFAPRAPRAFWNETKKLPGELGSNFKDVGHVLGENIKETRKPRSWFRDDR